MGQKQSYEVSKEASAVKPIVRESAEDEIKANILSIFKIKKKQKASRDPTDAPVITPTGTPKQGKRAVGGAADAANIEVAAEEQKHEERSIDESVRKVEEEENTVHILPYSEGELATIHNILVTDEPKETAVQAVA
ncbi:hypothetical protein PFISCL1PPCAC_7150, partial [Pristionchus fissidentatus]